MRSRKRTLIPATRYGSIVTDIVREEIIYSGEWSSEEPDLEKSIEKYNRDGKRYLFYPWGIFVTAYCRRLLLSTILAVGPDYVYADTDSVKFLHHEDHKAFFERINTKITEKAEKMCSYYKIDRSMIRPVTIKGTEKPIGVFDYEGTYDKFRTLGAKRYMTLKDGELSITVSGVNKHTALPYLKTFKDPFRSFTDALLIPPEYSGKLTHTYIDEEASGSLTDAQGHTVNYHEYSAVHLEPAAYELSLSARYINYLKGIRERSK